MRKITDIVVHCADTPKGKYFDINDVRDWHINPKALKKGKYRYKGKTYENKQALPVGVRNQKGNGWTDVGYHYIVLLDGTIQLGRDLKTIGSHVGGYNKSSIGICYIGGKHGLDTRTTQQKASLVFLIATLKRIFRKAKVSGHRDFPNVKKYCPSFDAKHEYKNL